MAEITEYHRYLFLRKVTSSLSEAETKELDSLFLQNDDAKREYEELLNTLPADDVSNSFKKLGEPGFWKNHIPDSIQTYRRREKTKRILLRSSAFVLIIAAITSGAIFLSRDQRKPQITNPVIAQNEKTIELKLANGKLINLSEKTGTITTDAVDFNNVDGTLSYKSTGSPAGTNTVVVPAGMDYKIKLSDGSEVWMNSETTLEFPSQFTGGKREITISGEAYLSIVKNSKMPFFVQLPNSSIQVTGTEFNVNTYDSNAVNVALVKGGLNFVTKSKTVKVEPGVMAVYRSPNTIDRKEFDAKRTLSWREGIFYFDGASLDEIARVVSRWYGIKTKIDRSVLLEKQFAGILNKHQPIEMFLDNMKTISQIEGYFDAQGVLHFK